MRLRVVDVKGGVQRLKALRGRSIDLSELLNELFAEETQYMLTAEGEIRVEAYDFTGAFMQDFIMRPEPQFGEVTVYSRSSINMLAHDLRPETAQLSDLAGIMKSYGRIIGKAAVAYSGGLDSSVLAHVLRDSSPLLITVGFEQGQDIENARSGARELGLEHLVHIISSSELKEAVEAVKPFCHTLMDLSLASGFFIFGKTAKENGYNRAVVGQMADELFGGYARHRRAPPEALEGLLREDIKRGIYGLRRDTRAILMAGVEPLYPYAFRSFFRKAQGLPLSLRREKLGLRKIGELLGVPQTIVWKQKKAFQYGSGIERAVREIIRLGI
ncbi:MAG: asparagine synthase C-terminal domain-containing protein [Nitrososphaeria archaeon]